MLLTKRKKQLKKVHKRLEVIAYFSKCPKLALNSYTFAASTLPLAVLHTGVKTGAHFVCCYVNEDSPFCVLLRKRRCIKPQNTVMPDCTYLHNNGRTSCMHERIQRLAKCAEKTASKLRLYITQ